MLFLQPARNVTFLSDSSFLVKKPYLQERARGFTIGLSFQVPRTTPNGLLFLESHDMGVSQSGSTVS